MRESVGCFQAYFLSAAFFSLVINLLMLAPALFMLQVFDRVVSSRSVETRVMLFVLTLMALVCMAYLDAIRARLLARAALMYVLDPVTGFLQRSLREPLTGPGGTPPAR